MVERDIFVSLVALILGALMLYSAIIGDGWCFRMTAARIIESRRGRGFARGTIGGIGSLLILIGVQTFISVYAPANSNDGSFTGVDTSPDSTLLSVGTSQQ